MNEIWTIITPNGFQLFDRGLNTLNEDGADRKPTSFREKYLKLLTYGWT